MRRRDDVDDIVNRLRRLMLDVENGLSRLELGAENDIKTFKKYTQNYEYAMQNKDRGFFDYNENDNLSNFNFVLKLYTGRYFYKVLNNFLRGEKYENKKYDKEDLASWTWCMHRSLTKRKSNVKNDTWVYRGVKNNFPLDIGDIFYFAEFVSTSLDINIAKNFAQGGTLFKIKIKNNEENPYCRNISKISDKEYEKEVLITAFCKYKVINYNFENGLDIYSLICYGYKKI